MERRDFLVTGAAGVAILGPLKALAQDDAAGADRAKVGQELVAAAIAGFTGGVEPTEGGVTLTAPEIAENGNTVPVAIDAPNASEVLILAPKNPVPPVATFRFGPLAGSHKASTRIRLIESQDVIAIAKLDDGSFGRATAAIKVTIGGCGG